MLTKQSRAKRKREDWLIQSSWKTAIEQDAYFFMTLDRRETELTQKLLVFDRTDLEIADLQITLACQHHELGATDKAIDLMEQAMGTYQIHYSNSDPHFLANEAQLAEFYHAGHRHEEAAIIIETHLALRLLNAHSQDSKITSLSKQLAEIYQACGQDMQAIVIFEELVELATEQLDSPTQQLALAKLGLAEAYRVADMTAAAINTLNDLMQTAAMIWPVHNEHLLAIYWEFASNYAELGCYREALSWTQSLLQAEISKAGIHRIDMANLLEFQADLYFKIGDWLRGQGNLQEAYQLSLMLRGKDALETKRLKQKLNNYVENGGREGNYA